MSVNSFLFQDSKSMSGLDSVQQWLGDFIAQPTQIIIGSWNSDEEKLDTYSIKVIKQEDQMIKHAIEQSKKKKWPHILQLIQSQHCSFSRTAKQIRERWKYFLDPAIKKQKWDLEEEKILFRSHQMYGSRWKEIQRLLPGRTQKAIKNQFYSTILKSIRHIHKTFGMKNSTHQVREIKPCVINLMVESGNSNPALRQSIYHLFYFCKRQQIGTEFEIPSLITNQTDEFFRNFLGELFYFKQHDYNRSEQCKINKEKFLNCFKAKGDSSQILPLSTFDEKSIEELTGCSKTKSEQENDCSASDKQEIVDFNENFPRLSIEMTEGLPMKSIIKPSNIFIKSSSFLMSQSQKQEDWNSYFLYNEN